MQSTGTGTLRMVKEDFEYILGQILVTYETGYWEGLRRVQTLAKTINK